MLFYLDNWQSADPNAADRATAGRGRDDAHGRRHDRAPARAAIAARPARSSNQNARRSAASTRTTPAS